MRKFLVQLLVLALPVLALGQDAELTRLLAEQVRLKSEMEAVEAKIEARKLALIQADLLQRGLPALAPGEVVVKHSAMALVYNEPMEQAKWVAHVIAPDVVSGRVTRSNDFRVDPAIATGSSEEKDYFLTSTAPDGKVTYDGFGFDRGHLAPSADFRWSAAALSESYFYSNMSPQTDAFNRETWADLEAKVRGYVFRNKGASLHVVTGPIIDANPARIERGVHKVAIPKAFFKVVADIDHGRAIAFMVPHEASTASLGTFAMTIDALEQVTGIDFFASLPDDLEAKLESQKEVKDWLPEEALGNVEPLFPPNLPKNHFNTVQAKLYMDKNQEVTICGTVVGARTSKKGNILLNLDKQYPDQVFTVFIKEEDIPNFSYNPEEVWNGKVIAATGKVVNLGGTPAMFVVKEADLKEFKGK